MNYLQPANMAEAIEALKEHGGRIIAGGTDLYPANIGKLLAGRLVDLSGVAEMREIAVAPGAVRIGGAVTWTELGQAKLPPAFAALQQAARQVGSRQVQNRGTIAGNLCNASPAADGVPPLLVLDAEVELASAVGLRRMALRDFIAGYRKTLLQPGEFLAAVIVPTVPAGNSAFVKLGARKYLVISIVMVAAVVEKDRGGAVVSARIAVGSASEKALRLHDLERELAGCAAGKAPSALLRPEHFDCLSPIGDVRATAAYRLEAARQLVGEALDRASGFET